MWRDGGSHGSWLVEVDMLGSFAPSSLENLVGYLLVPVEMSVICLGQVLFRVLGMVL